MPWPAGALSPRQGGIAAASGKIHLEFVAGIDKGNLSGHMYCFQIRLDADMSNCISVTFEASSRADLETWVTLLKTYAIKYAAAGTGLASADGHGHQGAARSSRSTACQD